MESLLSKVKRASKEMGEAPYDDKQTREAISVMTKKAFEEYEKLKKEDSKV